MNTVTIYNANNQLIVTLKDHAQLGDRSYESGAFGFNFRTSDQTLLVWKHSLPPAKRPWSYRSAGIDHQDYITDLNIAFWKQPLLVLVQERQIFTNPSFPKKVTHVLNLAPAAPNVFIFLGKNTW